MSHAEYERGYRDGFHACKERTSDEFIELLKVIRSKGSVLSKEDLLKVIVETIEDHSGALDDRWRQ